ncbi:MAG: hypothetical protein ACLFRF_07410 [Desulfobacterales bacterium]
MLNNQTNRYPGMRRLVPAYIRAGLLLHVMTIMELAVLAAFAPALLWFQAESAAGAVLNMAISAFLISLPIFSQLDARSRFQSYKRVKDSLVKHGFDPRILRPFIKSRCQRDAVLAAADELGCKPQCRSYFRSRGYRWYHILPDFVISNPVFLLSRQFWQSTFFAKTYRSRSEF